MGIPSEELEFSDNEIARRRDEALRRALNTPPQPKLSPKPRPASPAASTNAGKRGQADEAS